MSQFYSSVKRHTALCSRLSQLRGKLKFAIRRGIRKLVLAVLFAIETLEGKIKQLDTFRPQNVQTPQSVSEPALKFQKTPPMSKFETYLESLQLPQLMGSQSPEQLALAVKIRDKFVKESLFHKLTYDPTSPLLVFAPYILKLRKFQQALYWIDHEYLDYAVRVEIHNLATNQYYDSYPTTSKDVLAVPGIASNANANHFFCRQKTGGWEIWHYLVSDVKSA